MFRWWLGLTGNLEALWSHRHNRAYVWFCCTCLIAFGWNFCEIRRTDIFIIIFIPYSFDTFCRSSPNYNWLIEIGGTLGSSSFRTLRDRLEWPLNFFTQFTFSLLNETSLLFDFLSLLRRLCYLLWCQIISGSVSISIS